MGNFTHANQKFLKKHMKGFNTIVRNCAKVITHNRCKLRRKKSSEKGSLSFKKGVKFMPLEKKVALSIAAVGTIIAKLLGGWDMGLQYLVLFMAIDYVTGISRAFKDKVLSSEIGINGILKKVMILFIVAVAVGIDNVTGAQGVVRLATIWFYMGMEGISILENAAKLGVPIPDKIKDALLQIKDGGKKADKEEVK